MRYSEILGPAFYGISLTEEQSQRIDAHFLAAAHYRCLFSRTREPEVLSKFNAHIESMREEVSLGDFSNSMDPSGGTLGSARGWLTSELPEGLFDLFTWPDPRYKSSHPSDILLVT